MLSIQDAWVLDTFGVNPADYTVPARKPGEIGGILKSIKARLGVGATAAKPVPRAALGPAQSERAQALKQAMPPAEQQRIDKIMVQAKGDETAYLTKALASGHTAAEIETFYAAIKGKNHTWMENNLHIVDDTTGHGVKQQWEMSCAPTSVQAIKAELDPIYALKLRTENPKLEDADASDGNKLSPKLAKEQGDMLLSQGAQPTNLGRPGAGLSLNGVETLFNSTSSATGVSYKTEEIDDTDVDASLAKMQTAISSGLPVPLLVGHNGVAGHAVLMTGYDPGPPRRYAIHDPSAGKTVTVTDAQIKSKGLNVAGWTELTDFLEPSATPASPPTAAP